MSRLQDSNPFEAPHAADQLASQSLERTLNARVIPITLLGCFTVLTVLMSIGIFILGTFATIDMKSRIAPVLSSVFSSGFALIGTTGYFVCQSLMGIWAMRLWASYKDKKAAKVTAAYFLLALAFIIFILRS